MESVVILRKTSQNFRTRAAMNDQMNIDAALAEVFEAKPGKARFTAVFVGSVLSDDADFDRGGGHCDGT